MVIVAEINSKNPDRCGVLVLEGISSTELVYENLVYGSILGGALGAGGDGKLASRHPERHVPSRADAE